MENTITITWKVYGVDGRQKETLRPSSYDNMDTEDNPYRRPVQLEILNADKTGTSEYAVVKVTAPTEKECIEEMQGQLSDGAFENYKVGRIERV